MRIREALNDWFGGRLRKMVSAVATHVRAWRKANDRKGSKQYPRSPLYQAALATERALWAVKLTQRSKSFWYPYPTLRDLKPLEQLLIERGFDLLKLCQGPNAKVADIGTADGDLAFFLEEMGLSVDAIDFEPTNFNQMEGIRILKKALTLLSRFSQSTWTRNFLRHMRSMTPYFFSVFCIT